MAANVPVAGPNAKGKGTTPIGPPKKGYDIQYERLLMEELSLKNARKDYFLNSKQCRGGDGDSSTNDAADELQTLKISGMLHRASLEGVLIAAQHAAGEVRADPTASADYDRGLERPDAQDALATLWTMKSRQLEEDDNEIPVSVGRESLAWRQRFSSEICGQNDSMVMEAHGCADHFFRSVPECRRSNDLRYNEIDESDSDEESFVDQKPKSAKKNKNESGSKDVINLVTCTSSSPSPEKLADNQKKKQSNKGMHIESAVVNRNAQNNQRKEPSHGQQNQPRPVSNSDSSRNWGNQQPPNKNNNDSNNRNPYQQSQRPQNHANNPYQRQQRGGPQQNQWKNNEYQQQQQQQQQNPYQNQAAFDYNDNNSHHNVNNDRSEPATKKNPFCTAKELGPSFNNKSRGRGGDEEDWDNYGNNGDAYSGNNHSRQMGNDANNRSAPGGPQNMVRAAIRGPKDNISAGLKRKFQPPMKREGGGSGNGQPSGNNYSKNSNSSNNNHQGGGTSNNGGSGGPGGGGGNDDEELPEELRGLDKELIEKINNEIVDSGESITFADIAGLENAKRAVNELVILPMLRPEIFVGIRSCPKGLLLFGPPGTGKTLIGKAIAHESGATFFSISSSSLTSKWIGEGEKLVRTLFAVASYRAPSVVFIDEVDSMLTQRKADENEASRRIKTEFLVQLDGAGNGRKGQVLVIGATNLPQELDDAARRRFVKKLYIPLPDHTARETLLRTLLANNSNTLTSKDITKLSQRSEGFSGADLKNLCQDAAMEPVRELGEGLKTMKNEDIPPISYKHFRRSLRGMSPSVAQSDLVSYIEWNNTYGNKVSNVDDSCDSDTGSECESP